MEKLAVQKCKAEKELLMYKRVRMEQDSAEERRKSGVIEIQRKIERLLFLESER